MPISSLPVELHREIILQSSDELLDPLQAERAPLYSSGGALRYGSRISKRLALVSQSWNVRLSLSPRVRDLS